MKRLRRLAGAIGMWLAAASGVAVAQVPAAVVAKAEPAPPIPAQAAETDPVAVQVTDSSGGSIFLDQGRDAGIEIGHRVLLYSRTHGIVTGTIRGVARKSANCTLDAGFLAVEIGTRGEVLVPKGKPSSVPGPKEVPSRPEHPPWTNPPENWNNDNPLLMPAYSRPSSERPFEVTGYTFMRGSYSTNRLGTGNVYMLGEAGVDATLLNALPWGGLFKVRTEYQYESAQLDSGSDTRDSSVRLDWMSCLWGGGRTDSFRAELGRFLHREFSELGVIDGAEGSTRLGSHWRVGGSLGELPDYHRELDLTRDYEGSVFAKFLSGPREEFTLGVAYQRTLHNGDWDRDLFVAVTEIMPSPWFSARASLWVDYYTGSEQVKSPGLEVTEAHAYASYRFNVDHNAGVFFTRSRRPDVLRDELAPEGEQPTPEMAELLRQNLSVYYGAYTWHRLSRKLVADTRVSLWRDQDDESGISGEAHVGFQDLLFDKGEVGFTAFYTDGIYTRGPGVRVTISHLLAPVSILAWYESAWYENTTTRESDLHQAFHLSIDAALSDTWSVSLSADYRIDSDQESVTFLVSIMKRIR